MSGTLNVVMSASLAYSTLALALAPGLVAQSRDSSGAASAPFFTRRDAITAGAFAAGTALLLPLDREIAERFQRPALQSNTVLSGTSTVFRNLGYPLTVFGIASVAYGAGRIGRDGRLADIGLHTGESIVTAEVLDFIVKGVAGRSRPYVSNDTNPDDFRFLRGFRKGEDYSSFPSGHAAASFAAAAALGSEGARWWPDQKRYVTPLAYTGATLVALSRLYNNKHWASDVAFGAMIGTLSGQKLVRHQHARPGNWLDRIFLSSSVAPTGSGYMVLLSATW